MVRWQVAVIVAGNSYAAFAAKTATTLVFAPPRRSGQAWSCRQPRPHAVACPLPPGADNVDSTEGMATLEAMSGHHNFRPGQQNKLVGPLGNYCPIDPAAPQATAAHAPPGHFLASTPRPSFASYNASGQSSAQKPPSVIP